MNTAVILPLIIFLFIFFIIGFWANRYVQSTNSFLQEYFLGGRASADLF